MWQSITHRSATDYNNYRCTDGAGMQALRAMFPDAIANSENFVLFSTSGIHGTYQKIESAENNLEESIAITFLIIQPRICTMRHGVCVPENTDDITFLKTLRATSREAMAGIG